ncbi:MAG TPA: endonuclease [Clostridiales bacterium]|nr:endonuclease [Clostridiales bacterium]
MNAPYAKPQEWHDARKLGIGGSDANILLSGDAQRILFLWEEKLGRREPEDLTWVLPVQMGSATEDLNAAFYTHATGRQISGRNSIETRHDRPYMRCELDGMTFTEAGEDAIFEAKHVNAFSTIEDVVQRYMPQLHHNMHCARVRHAVLSVFVGTQKHEIFEVAMDDFYLAALLDAEEDFWRCVETETAPEGCEPPPAPVAFEALREVDMTGSNEWASSALDWLANKDAAKKFEKAAKSLKGCVENDVGRAFGHGVQIKRSKAGSLTISAEK